MEDSGPYMAMWRNTYGREDRMKIGIVCDINDKIEVGMYDPNDPMTMMDMFAEALSKHKRLVVCQVDNSGVSIERSYPKQADEHPDKDKPTGGLGGKEGPEVPGAKPDAGRK